MEYNDVLEAIDMKEDDFARFRGVFIKDSIIYVRTRTGGNNRSMENVKIYKNPYFIRTYDDNFDSTYAYYLYRIPVEDNLYIFFSNTV